MTAILSRLVRERDRLRAYKTVLKRRALKVEHENSSITESKLHRLPTGLFGGITFSWTKEVLLALPAAASVQRVLAELRAYEIL